MAIGDIPGDIKTQLGQDLTPEQRLARQTALAQGGAPSSSASIPIPAPAGPIGRAQQQLPSGSGLSDVNLGVSGQAAPRQTSFDITNTPAKYLPPVAQQPPVTQSVTSPPAAAPAQASPPAVQQVPAPASGLSQVNLVTPTPQGPQTPPLTNLSQLGSTVGAGLISPPPVTSPTTPNGPVPTATSPTVDPYNIQSVKTQTSLHNANLIANPTPVDPATLPGPITADQFRPTGVGADALGGQIVARVGANGEAQFSNAPADQRSAQGLGQISVIPAQAQSTSVDNQPATLASLGSAGNLGDGIGTFSQAQPGDAALASARFGRASDLRQAFANHDRLDQANARNDQAAQLTIVHDSAKPLTKSDQIQSQLDEQAGQARQQNINNAQSLINVNLQNRSGEQQLKQTSSLNDLQVRATAPDATAADQLNYLRAKDPAGLLKLQQTAPQAAATLAKTQAETDRTRQETSQSNTTQQQAQQDRQRSIEGQVSSVDQALASVNKILGTTIDPKNPDGPRLNEDKGLKAAVGLSSILPTRPGSAAADFEARNETLKAQTFLPQVSLLKGMGALSNTEGERLADSIASLSTKQSPEAYRANLKIVADTFARTKARLQSGTLITPGSGQEFAEPITFGAQPAKGGKLQAQAPRTASAANPVQISTEEGYKALPSGAQYIDPQGNHRSKP